MNSNLLYYGMYYGFFYLSNLKNAVDIKANKIKSIEYVRDDHIC